MDQVLQPLAHAGCTGYDLVLSCQWGCSRSAADLVTAAARMPTTCLLACIQTHDELDGCALLIIRDPTQSRIKE